MRDHINPPYTRLLREEQVQQVQPGDIPYNTADPIPDGDTVPQPSPKRRWGWVWDNGLGTLLGAAGIVALVVAYAQHWLPL